MSKKLHSRSSLAIESLSRFYPLLSLVFTYSSSCSVLVYPEGETSVVFFFECRLLIFVLLFFLNGGGDVDDGCEFLGRFRAGLWVVCGEKKDD